LRALFSLKYYHLIVWGLALVLASVSANYASYRPSLDACYTKYFDGVNPVNVFTYFFWVGLSITLNAIFYFCLGCGRECAP
jgi:hypothetical protein